jgi:phospholipid/cholesterol/gamma-HCH transport system substrate-binding protein
LFEPGDNVKTETRVGAFIIIAIGIFLYLSINIGEIRFDSSSYALYKTYCDDTGGLELKSPVKIAGVNVGWVETINLLEDGRAELLIRIKRSHKLARNAYATISQDGLIGSKTIEIDPGDPSTGTLPPGSRLAIPSKTPATVADLLESLREITDSVQDVIAVFKGVFASPRGEGLMQQTLDNVSQASQNLSDFSHTIDASLKRNDEKIDSVIANIDRSADSLASSIPHVETAISNAGDELSHTAQQFGQTATLATETFSHTQAAARKVNEGSGTLGKLINDSQLHRDIHDTVKGMKGFVGKAHHLAIDIDGMWETAFRTDNSRGIIGIELRTVSDYFYRFELSSDNYGHTNRITKYFKRYDAQGKQIDSTSFEPDTIERGEVIVDREEIITKDFTRAVFGFQFCKSFDKLTFRLGMFENNFGAAIDFKLPVTPTTISWTTSFEAFDFMGYHRINDDRPYLRWRNKLSFMDRIYTTFGIEDIFSRRDAAPFWGTGITFNDDDLKYMISLLPFSSFGG